MSLNRLAVLAGVGIALAAALPATAQDAPASPPADPVGDLVGAAIGPQSPPPQPAPADAPSVPASSAPAPTTADGVLVRPPSPAMTTGTKLSFTLVSTDEVRGGSRDGVRTNQQAIELQIMPRRAKGRVIRYVIRSGTVADDPLGAALLNASRDLATDFEADPSGKPLRLADWEGVRAAILKKLITDESAPVEGVQRVQAMLGAMDPVSAIPFAIPETLMISDMQGWAPLAPGRHDDPAGVVMVGGRQARMISQRGAEPPDKAACTVRLVRATTLDPASPAAGGGKEADSLETTAEVSTVDGWVVRLTQTRTHKSGAASDVRTWTLTRDDPPACKAG